MGTDKQEMQRFLGARGAWAPIPASPLACLVTLNNHSDRTGHLLYWHHSNVGAGMGMLPVNLKLNLLPQCQCEYPSSGQPLCPSPLPIQDSFPTKPSIYSGVPHSPRTSVFPTLVVYPPVEPFYPLFPVGLEVSFPVPDHKVLYLKSQTAKAKPSAFPI